MNNYGGGNNQQGYNQYGQSSGQGYSGGGQWFGQGQSGNYQGNPASFEGSGTQAYVIKAKTSSRCLDACQTNDHGNHQGDLILYDYMGASNQQWLIIKQGQDFILKNAKSGLVLEVVDNGTSGTYNPISNSTTEPRVREGEYNGSYGQKWRIQQTNPGSAEYYIYHSSGKALDIRHAKDHNNTPIIPYAFSGHANQIWRIQLA